MPPTPAPTSAPPLGPLPDHPLLRVDRPLRSALSGVVVSTFALLTLTVLLQVFSRHVLPIALTWLEDLAKGLLVWLSLLGSALAYAERQHLGIDLLLHPMHPQPQDLLHRIGHALIGLFALLVLVLGGSTLAWQSIATGQTIPGTPLNRAAVYAAVPVCGLLIAWFALVAAWFGTPPADPTPAPTEPSLVPTDAEGAPV